MRHPIRFRFALLAAASMLGQAAMAQELRPVQVFDEAPPLELLRSIVVPESRPGLSRKASTTC